MKLSGKMTVRFIAYFILFYGVLFIGTAIMVVLFMTRFVMGLYFHDIRALEQDGMKAAIVESDHHSYRFSDSLVDIARRSGGIVQLLNAEGNVLASSSEGDAHSSYDVRELLSLSNEKDIWTWEVDDMIVVFQEFTESDQLLVSLQKGQLFPQLTGGDLQLLKDQEAVFELFDADGEKIYSTATTSTRILSESLLLSSQSVNDREELISHMELDNGDIAVLSMRNPHYQALEQIDKMLVSTFAKWFVIFHLVLLVITLGISLWIGRIFGKPVFHFLKRIERLSNSDFSQPNDRKIRRRKDGRLKRKYRIYEDVDTSLERLTENLIENKRIMTQTEKLREDWITGLSHDLKTPLSSIYGYSAMLASDHKWSPEEIKAFANTMMEKSGYMDELIKDLTYTYQLKNEGAVLNKERINLFNVVFEYIQRSDWYEVISITGNSNLFVEIDIVRFARVLDNIVGNAVNHNPEGTKVHITISGENDMITLTVADEGEGMSQDALDHLFNRYYRGTNTLTDGSGTGLGLTIAKQIMEAHGGKVEAASSAQGTSIIIQLPRV